MAWSKTAACTCLAVIVTSPAGCLDLKKSYPEKRSFVLDVGAPPQDTPANGAIVLKINKLRVSPLFAGRAMVYRVADLQYESDFYDEWFVAPGTLVTQQVHQWLSRSAGFQMVIVGHKPRRADASLGRYGHRVLWRLSRGSPGGARS